MTSATSPTSLPPFPPKLPSSSSSSSTPTSASPTARSLSSSSSSPSSSSSAVPPSLSHIFQDLESRFFLNLPDDELSSFERLFFQLQQAQWFYLDFYHDRFPHSLPAYSLKAFCAQFFALSPLLSSFLERFDLAYQSFVDYLGAVPVCGAILLNPPLTHCLMVRGWKGNSWGFPRGKIDQGEDEVTCAIREVREEVGYDVAGAISDSAYVEASVNGKHTKLFIVEGVDMATAFETRTRKEISAIEWVEVARLPSYRSRGAGADDEKDGGADMRKKNYWNVTMFVDELRRWIARRKGGKQPRPSKAQQKKARTPQSRATSANIPIPVHSSTPPPLHTALSTSVPARSSLPRSSSIDQQNSSTFSLPSSSPTQGWSAEEMFRLNERLYGVTSTVPEEKLEVPANIDDIMREVLGRKYRGGATGGAGRGGKENVQQQQQQQQQPSTTAGGRGGKPQQHRNTRSELVGGGTQLTTLTEQQSASQRGRGRGRGGRGGANNQQPPASNQRYATLPADGRLNVEELDFSHNPYRHHALSITTSPPIPSAHSSSPASPKIPSALTVKSASPALLTVHSAVERNQPHSAGVAVNKDAAKAVSSFSDFSFDMDSILQPLSASPLMPSTSAPAAQSSSASSPSSSAR